MKHATLISLGLVIGTLSVAACDSSKNAPNSPQDRPPIVNGDSTPPANSDGPGSASSEAGTSASTSASAAGAADPTEARTTGDTVAGTGDTRPASKVIDDSWITTKTKTALLAESDLKAGDIKVETRRGTVTLSGTVPSAAQSDKASSVARSIEGVTNVDNRLAVRG